MSNKPIPPLNTLVSESVWRRGLVDTHFHSSALEKQGVDTYTLIESLLESGMGLLIDVAIEPEDGPLIRSASKAFSNVHGTCGLHPSMTSRTDWRRALSIVEQEIATGAYVAVGETGLDWYRMYAPVRRQLDVFEAHLSVAERSEKPVIVHNREADQDCLDRIRAASLPACGVMHCFSSSPEWVSRFLDAGMYISFAGNVTYRSAGELRDALRQVPMDRLLLETDAPFLTPIPHRGKTNHPGMVAYIYSLAAELKGVPLEELIKRVSENAETLFLAPRGGGG